MRIAAIALFALLLPPIALAHHSFNHYSTEIQKYDGVLVDLQWRNPHILLDIATAGPDGNEQILSMEAGSIYVFQRMGIERYNCIPRAQ